jgi:aryl carrier-like protein
MAARSGAAFRAYWTNLGMGFITPAAALEFVRRIVEARAITPPSMACFPPTDWFKFFNATRSAGAPPAFIEECLPPPDDASSSSSVSSEPLTTKAMDPCFISTVRGVVLEVLDAKTIDDDAPLMSVGLTSTRAIQLTDRLSKATGRAVPSTLAFDYPTLRDILAHFVSDNDLHLRSMSPSVVETGRDEITKVYFIASASIAPSAIGRGKFMDGGDSVDVVPLTRWDTAVAESLCVFGVFVEECFMFDARVFGVSHAEACVIDPQQRLRACILVFPKSSTLACT